MGIENALGPNWYSAVVIAGLLGSAYIWRRLTKAGPERSARDRFVLTIIYFTGLFGALIGAKLAFFFAEGWLYRDNMLALLTGRSITGALLGGYIAVELAKWKLKYTSTTGDLFAIIVPFALILGRIGCLAEGCCPGVECGVHWWTMTDAQGVPRWPAPLVELVFNAGFLGWSILAQRRSWCAGNRFHVYLIAYGAFRFAHEFARDNATWWGPIGGYHIVALLMVVFGVVRFRQRRRVGAVGRVP
ncbi:MAG: prolipoprotein diacylglyceryl transferase [Phycisphaerales bacterium]|nr:prolipoprotein diacylglyceryl transferase [Phycisphaerales bacterium]